MQPTTATKTALPEMSPTYKFHIVLEDSSWLGSGFGPESHVHKNESAPYKKDVIWEIKEMRQT